MQRLLAPLAALACLAATARAVQDGDAAAASPPPRPWTACADAVDWFVRVDTPDTEAELMQLVMGQRLVAHSREWIRARLADAPPYEAWLAEARRSGRPILWWVTAVEGQHVILPHLLDRYLDVGVFSDPAITALVERRFVPVKAPAGVALAERFGLATPEFLQPGLLVITPGGEVHARVDRLAVFQADPYAAFLRGVLGELEDARPSAALERAAAAWEAQGDVASGLAYAREAILDGELTAAERALARVLVAAPADARAPLLGARLARMRHDAAGALALLDELEGAELAAPLAQEARAERGLVALGRGDVQAAAAHLAAARALAGPRAAECGYHLGAALWAARREDDALAAWGRVVAEHPGSAWAARADAYLAVGGDGLRGEGPLVRAMEPVTWSPPLSPRTGSRAPLAADAPDAEVDALVAQAVGFLLRQQRADGAWLGARWGGDGGPPPDEPVGEGPGLFANVHTAISALACSALLAHADAPGVERAAVAAALARGERYLLRDDLVQRGVVTAWVYADAFRLWHFARRHPDAAARPAAVAEAMEAWIGHLVDQQAETDGPFRHYSYTSTFVTAMVLLALDAARDAGCAVPDDVFARGADVLAGARDGEDGLFGYLVDAPAVNRTTAGAACRQPLCTLALLRCGRTTRADVAGALDLYLESYARCVEPPRASNFHMPGLDGSAGYFFFHNLLAAALAVAETGERGAERAARLRARLLELPDVDGTFLDSGFSYGKAYSTAAALLALDALDAARKERAR